MVKNPTANAGDIRDPGWILGSGRFPGGRHGNPLQYSCLENPMDRGAWRATVHGVAKSQTRLSNLACTHAPIPKRISEERKTTHQYSTKYYKPKPATYKKDYIS